MRLRRKSVVKDALKEYKRVNDNGYEKITQINDKWTIPVQVGFTKDSARIMVPEAELDGIEGDYDGEIEVKKGFSRVYFEKRGAGYSSVASDYYIPTLTMPITLKINDYGEQIINQRKNGYKMSYVDTTINVQDFIATESWDKLSDDDKNYLSAVDTGSLRADLIEYLSTVPRVETPYNFALFELSQNYSLFHQITEDLFIDVPSNQWTCADIRLTIGKKVFEISKYSVACKNDAGEEEFGFMVFFDFKDEILNKVKEDGYK